MVWLAEAHGAEAIYLVGSVATGADRDAHGPDVGSDVDFYVPSFTGDDTWMQRNLLESALRDLLGERVQVHRGDGTDVWQVRPDYEARMKSEAIDLRALL